MGFGWLFVVEPSLGVERSLDAARCERAPLRDYETLDVATNGDTALG